MKGHRGQEDILTDHKGSHRQVCNFMLENRLQSSRSEGGAIEQSIMQMGSVQ